MKKLTHLLKRRHKLDKQNVDQIIVSYTKNIYGFSLSKMKNLEQAEELSARIIYEVYRSLLRKDRIFSLDSYIFRIACNIYAIFIKELSNEQQEQTHNQAIIFDDDIVQAKKYQQCYQEIAYLNSIQRKIVILHYFYKQSLVMISQQLMIPLGTVKWHLVEARNQIKRGFQNPEKFFFDPAQKRFLDLKTAGLLGGYKIDWSVYFSKSFSQYIAYSAYYTAKTPQLIAKELAIPTCYVEAEIAQLVQNGFMSKVSSDKYITTIYITEVNPEIEQKINHLLAKYVQLICNQYIPELIKACQSFFCTNEGSSKTSHSINNDLNFFVYSAISLICQHKLSIDYPLKMKDFFVKREDGGQYIAYTTVGIDTPKTKNNYAMKKGLSYDQIDQIVESLSPVEYPFQIWQLTSHFDTRTKYGKNWEMMLYEDYYDFFYQRPRQINTHLNDINPYIRLLEKGFICSKIRKDTPIPSASTSFENSDLKDLFTHLVPNLAVIEMKPQDFIKIMPNCSTKILNKGKKLDDLIYQINKQQIPPHLHDLCRVMSYNTLSSTKMRVMILDELIKNGTLAPLKTEQKATVNMIMFVTKNNKVKDHEAK